MDGITGHPSRGSSLSCFSFPRLLLRFPWNCIITISLCWRHWLSRAQPDTSTSQVCFDLICLSRSLADVKSQWIGVNRKIGDHVSLSTRQGVRRTVEMSIYEQLMEMSFCFRKASQTLSQFNLINCLKVSFNIYLCSFF